MTNKDIEKFIRFLVDSTLIYTVDEGGYVVSKTSKDRVKIKVDDESPKKDLVVFSGVIENPDDVIILNPLNENIGETEDQKFLYIALSFGVGARLLSIIKWTMDLQNTKDGLSPSLVKFLSKYNESIDNKTKDEIEKITKDMLEFCNIFYNKKQKKTIFRTCVFEENSQKKFSGVRKKTWNFLENLFSEIFQLESDDKLSELKEKYSFKSIQITCPRLESFLMVYEKVISRINEYLELFENDDMLVDLDELGYHIRHLNEYYDKVKWIAQPSSVCVKTKTPSISKSDPEQEIPLTSEEGEERSLFDALGIPGQGTALQQPIGTNNSVFGSFANYQQPMYPQPQFPFGGYQQPQMFNSPIGMGNDEIPL